MNYDFFVVYLYNAYLAAPCLITRSSTPVNCSAPITEHLELGHENKNLFV